MLSHYVKTFLTVYFGQTLLKGPGLSNSYLYSIYHQSTHLLIFTSFNLFSDFHPPFKLKAPW